MISDESCSLGTINSQQFLILPKSWNRNNVTLFEVGNRVQFPVNGNEKIVSVIKTTFCCG